MAFGSAASLTFDIFGRDRTASRALNGVGRSAENANTKMGKLGKVGRVAGVALAAGVGLATAAAAVAIPALYNAAQSASALNEAANKSNVVFGKSAGVIDKWASTAANRLGLAKSEALGAAGSFGTMFSQLGIGTQRAASMSTSLVDLAADLASFHNIAGGAAEVTDMMSAAMRGEYDSLQRVIPTINAAAVQHKALEMTGKGSAAALTESEKAAATYKLIMEGAGPAVGDMARTSEGFANVQRRLSATFKDLSAQVGGPVMNGLANLGNWFLQKGVPVLRQFGEQILPKLRDMFNSMKKTVDDNRPGLERFGQIMANVGQFILKYVVPAILKFHGAVWNNLIKAIAGLGKVLPPVVSGMLKGIGLIVGGFRGLLDAVLTTFSGILTAAEKGMGWIPGIGPKIKSAKKGFEDFRSSAMANLKKVESNIQSARRSVDNFGKAAKSIPEAKLRADIKDLTAKTAEARRKLKDPELTKTRRAELKAEIAQLVAQTRKARGELAAVKSKTVTLTLRQIYLKKIERIGQSMGGLVQGPGTGTSDSVLRWLSNGEYVLRAAAVKKIGLANLDTLNTGNLPTVASPSPWPTGSGGPATVNVTVQVQGRSVSTSRDIAADVRDMLLDLQRVTGRKLLVAS